VFVIVDGAASARDTADHMVIAVFAVAPDGDLLVLWVMRERLEVEQIIPAVQHACEVWWPDWVGIEANGFQVWFIREARDKARYPAIPTVRELDPAGKGKAARAAAAIIRAEAGQIYLPAASVLNPWVGPFEEEHFGFTGREGREDGTVDCLSYAVLAVDRLGYGTYEVLPEPFSKRLPGVWN
jgi:hypothetical protein